MPVTEEILRTLDRLKSQGQLVRLLNVYKGLPITYDATILNLSRESLVLSTNKFQAICLEMQRRTFVQSKAFNSVVRASVVGVDMIKETVALTALIYMTGDIGKRLLVRVQPKDAIPVEVNLSGTLIKSHMADISVGGLGVTTGLVLYRPSFFTLRSKATVAIHLPNARLPLRLPAVLMNVRGDSSSYRLGFSLTPDASARIVISQYISQRQAEIQRELHMMHEMFLQMAIGRQSAEENT